MMISVTSEKSVILITGTRLYNRVSRCYDKKVEIILTQELNELFQTLPRHIGATLILDLSLFNDNVDHSEVSSIFAKGFEQRIIVFTSEQDESQLYKLFEQGARGFCHSTISDEMLVKAINVVNDGEFWMGRKLMGYMMNKLILDRAPSTQRLSNGSLTPREKEIAGYVAQGKCDKIIARDLHISPNTVKNHLHHIFDKLKIVDRFQLALIYHGIKL